MWPPLYMVFFVVVVASAAIASSRDGEAELAVLFGLHLATMVVVALLLVVFIVDCYRSPRVPDDRRTLWAVILFLGNLLAMPVYWWIYVRPGPRDYSGGFGGSSSLRST